MKKPQAPRAGFFKDDSNRHSDLRRHENRFLGLTSGCKPVFMLAWIGMPIGIMSKNLSSDSGKAEWCTFGIFFFFQ